MDPGTKGPTAWSPHKGLACWLGLSMCSSHRNNSLFCHFIKFFFAFLNYILYSSVYMCVITHHLIIISQT